MKATATKAILLAASLTFPTYGFAETTSKGAAAYNIRGSAKDNKGDVGRCHRRLQSRSAARSETCQSLYEPRHCQKRELRPDCLRRCRCLFAGLRPRHP